MNIIQRSFVPTPPPVAAPEREQKSEQNLKKALFLSDLDGTWLSKDPEQRAALDEGILQLREEYREKGLDLRFGYVTARPPERVQKEGLPTPDWTITFNGARVDQGSGFSLDAEGDLQKVEAFPAWESLNKQTKFHSQQALETCRNLVASGSFGPLGVSTIGALIDNPAADDSPYAAHLVFDLNSVVLTEGEKADHNGNGIPDIFEPQSFSPPEQLQDLKKQLSAALQDCSMQTQMSDLYLFHGKPYAVLDVASARADKGQAVDFVRRQEGVEPDHLIIAGDGGNDISMVTTPNGDDGRRAIIVGPDQQLRKAAENLGRAILAPPEMDSAQAVLSGLKQHLSELVEPSSN